MRRLPSPRTGLPEEQSSPAARLRVVSALASRHRRLVAALCAGGAVLVAVSALTPSPPAGNASGAGKGTTSSLGALPAAAGARAPGDAERVAMAVRLSDPAGLLAVRVGAHVEVLAGPAGDGGLPGSVNGAAPGSGGDIVAPDAVVLAVPAAPAPAREIAGRAGDEGAPGLLGAMTADGAGGAAGTTSGWDGVLLLAVPASDAPHLAAAAGTRSLSIAVGLPSAHGGAP